MPTAMTYRYFNIAFALTGGKTVIPDATDPSGVQTFNEGRGYKYALDPATDPAALILDRQQDNYLYFVITQGLQNLQQHYVPEFIDSAANSGSAFSYSKKDRVRLPATNETYESLVDSNTTTPPSSSWVVVPQTGTTYLPVAATVGGTGNAITATFSPAIGNPSTATAVWVRAAAANSGATTFNPDGSGAIAVYKGNNQPLVGGEIAGAGQWLLLIKDVTLSKWMLSNPYLTAATVPDASTVVKGIGYLATNVEAQTGTDATKFITPASLASVTATTSRAGLTETATNAEVQAQTDTSRYITPSGLGACTATTIRKGIAELATQAEVDAGISSDTIVTPETLKNTSLLPTRQILTPQRFLTGTNIYTFAHALGVKPFVVKLTAVCVTAEGGYVTGDTLLLSSYAELAGSTAGQMFQLTDSDVILRIANADRVTYVKTDFSSDYLTTNRWDFYVTVES